MLNKEKAYELLSRINDPEVPVLTILDLGIVRRVEIKSRRVEVDITPTYSGCPAMDTIEEDIYKEFKRANIKVNITLVLKPTWTTDWISEEGRSKLEAYGIAPPAQLSKSKQTLFGEDPAVKCPRCKSMNTQLVSQFGSTACKALYKCIDCLEPFDYFKCL